MQGDSDTDSYEQPLPSLPISPAHHYPEDWPLEPALLTAKQQHQQLLSLQFPVIEPLSENLLDLLIVQKAQKPPSRDLQQLMNNLVIEIPEPIRIQDGLITSYKLYEIRTKKRGSEKHEALVKRRYSDFQYLHAQLIEGYGGCLVPRLPEKNILASFDMQTAHYVKSRKQKLHRYLERILDHPRLKYTHQFVDFLFDFDNTFSEKKGSFSSQYKLEDTLYNLTSTAIESGYNLFNKYISGESEQPKPILIRQIKKQKQQQMAIYQVAVSTMTDVVNGLKFVVHGTCEQYYSVNYFNSICESLLTGNKIQTCKESAQPLGGSAHTQLVLSYQNLFQFIQTCRYALQRRRILSQQLQQLNEQYSSQEKRLKQNPRSINLDILRSKINRAQAKSDKFTDELLEELGTQVKAGRDMLGRFLSEIEVVRRQGYQAAL